eukprot:1153556-Pelagomonas_calceolata.AAC.7
MYIYTQYTGATGDAHSKLVVGYRVPVQPQDKQVCGDAMQTKGGCPSKNAAMQRMATLKKGYSTLLLYTREP